MAKNQLTADTTKTTTKKRSKTEGNIAKSKTTITNSNNKKKTRNTIDANGNKAPTSDSLPNGIKHEDHNEEQVEAKNKPSIKKEEKNKKEVKEEDEKEDTKNESPLYNFPMNRINRIIKAESDVRITQEAIFLINKASEKFIQLFSTEAFACSFLDKKNHISYQHLSSVVGKRKRFDFLSDFVPEKVKAEDALKETPSVET